MKKVDTEMGMELLKAVSNGKLYRDDGGIYSVLVSNVRLSYPAMERPKENVNDDGTKTYKYGGVAMLPKATHAAVRALLLEQINRLTNEAKVEVPDDRVFLKDGDARGQPEEYAGHWVVSFNDTRRPALLKANKERWDSRDSDLFYGGCYASVMLRPWLQNPARGSEKAKHGKRVNCGFSAAQFVRDGERFGKGHISDETVDEVFDEVDEDEI